MGGIAGVFGTAAPETITEMLQVLTHRGPDDQYVVSGTGYTLGARRLSVFGSQDKQRTSGDHSERIWASHNGAIYNFEELAEELRKSGAFAGHSGRTDRGVIPSLYRVHGLDFPKFLEGMFAISVYDEEAERALLVRDRSGEKPLYYLEHEGCLWYASEIKALLRVPGFERRLDLESLHHFLSYKNVPSPATIFSGIRSLDPGSRLLWQGGQIRSVERYWRLDWTPFEGKLDEVELGQEFIRLLGDGVRQRMKADAPVGFFLSGGIDSSLSVALAAGSSSEPIKTFTLTYGEDSSTPGKDLDLRCAREVAQRYGTDHHEEKMNPGDFKAALPVILSHFDEPFSGVVSTYFLARLMAQSVKVAVSGDGSDELFGSYLTHRLARPIDEFCRARRENRPVGDLGHFSGGQPREFLERIADPDPWRWKHHLAVFTDQEKEALYAPQLRDEMRAYSSEDHLRSAFLRLSAADPTNRVLESEFNTQLPDQVLCFTDRLSMAHSLEIRTAFLDTRVMEFVARLPERFKIRNADVKVLLKTAARPYLPDSVIDRPKEGFVLPVNQWLQSWLFDYAKEALSPSALRRHGLFDAGQVGRLLERFAQGDTRLSNKVMSLLSFQIWYDIYLQQVLPVPLGDAARTISVQSDEEWPLVEHTVAGVKVSGLSRTPIALDGGLGR